MPNFNINKKIGKIFNNHSVNNIKNTVNSTTNSVESFVKNIIKEAQNYSNLKELNIFLESITQKTNEFIKLDNNLYKIDDYYFNIGKKFKMYSHANRLKKIDNLELTSAPKFIAYSDLKNNTDCLLITQIKDSKNIELLPYNNMKSDITLEAKQNFIDDVNKLLKTGEINIDFLDTNNWYVVPSTKRIVISNWANFVNCDNEIEKSNFKTKISNLCGLIY